MKFKFYRKLKSNKEQVIQISGGLIGAIFIIAGNRIFTWLYNKGG
jgi:hypothetical protein